MSFLLMVANRKEFFLNTRFMGLDYRVLLVVIVCTSFLLLSPWGSPILNSDGAIEVLMAFWYRLPDDVYYWGQDRGGSLLPLLSALPVRLLHSDPLLTISVVRYLIMVAGMLGYFTIIRLPFCRLCFAIAFFLPAFPFSDIPWYTIGIEYSLLGILVGLSARILDSSNKPEQSYPIFSHGVFILVSVVAVWVSDAALMTTVLLAAFLVWKLWPAKKHRNNFMLLQSVALAMTLLVWAWLKSMAPIKTDSYSNLHGIESAGQSLHQLVHSVIDYLAFRIGDHIVSIGAWCMVMTIAATTLLRISIGVRGGGKKPYHVFFFLNAFSLLIMLQFSTWVSLNGMGRRYFIGVYVSLVIALLLWLQEMSEVKPRFLPAVARSLIGTALMGVFTTLYHFARHDPGNLTSVRSRISALPKDIGIIGNYWNSYIFSIQHPGRVIATPHERDVVRNPLLVQEVFRQPRLFLVRDQWMESFPDSIWQFGRRLERIGKERFMAGSYFCEYRIAVANE